MVCINRYIGTRLHGFPTNQVRVDDNKLRCLRELCLRELQSLGFRKIKASNVSIGQYGLMVFNNSEESLQIASGKILLGPGRKGCFGNNQIFLFNQKSNGGLITAPDSEDWCFSNDDGRASEISKSAWFLPVDRSKGIISCLLNKALQSIMKYNMEKVLNSSGSRDAESYLSQLLLIENKEPRDGFYELGDYLLDITPMFSFDFGSVPNMDELKNRMIKDVGDAHIHFDGVRELREFDRFRKILSKIKLLNVLIYRGVITQDDFMRLPDRKLFLSTFISSSFGISLSNIRYFSTFYTSLGIQKLLSQELESSLRSEIKELLSKTLLKLKSLRDWYIQGWLGHPLRPEPSSWGLWYYKYRVEGSPFDHGIFRGENMGRVIDYDFAIIENKISICERLINKTTVSQQMNAIPLISEQGSSESAQMKLEIAQMSVLSVGMVSERD